jgi:hypothetical protein
LPITMLSPHPSALLASTAAATTMPASSHVSAAVVYTPEEMRGVPNDLISVDQGIRLYLLGPHRPPQPPPPPVITGLLALPWTSPFLVTPVVFPGLHL